MASAVEKWDQITDLAGSAYVNFQNVCVGNPKLMAHPIFRLAMAQLREALIDLGTEPIDMPHWWAARNEPEK